MSSKNSASQSVFKLVGAAVAIAWFLIVATSIWNHMGFFIIVFYAVPVLWNLFKTYKESTGQALYKLIHSALFFAGFWSHDVGLVIVALLMASAGLFYTARRNR